MSYCKSDGKDKYIFVTKEDFDKTAAVSDLVEEEEYGIVLPDGSINWDCPCLGGLPNGPCGEEFKASFSCFHYSEKEPKGSDCYEQFVAMQECFGKHPELYSKFSSDDKDNQDQDEQETATVPSEQGDHPVPSEQGDHPVLSEQGDHPVLSEQGDHNVKSDSANNETEDK